METNIMANIEELCLEWKVLKSGGTFYVHCCQTLIPYLTLLVDETFGDCAVENVVITAKKQ